MTRFFGQAPGQDKIELLAETPKLLFAREVALHFEFEFDESGFVVGGVLYQGAQELPLKKVG